MMVLVADALHTPYVRVYSPYEISSTNELSSHDPVSLCPLAAWRVQPLELRPNVIHVVQSLQTLGDDFTKAL
jgi:hypothetical protein